MGEKLAQPHQCAGGFTLKAVLGLVLGHWSQCLRQCTKRMQKCSIMQGRCHWEGQSRNTEEYFFFFFNGLERLEEWEIRKQKIIPHPAGQLL